ncbi:hypothetical protein [Streptococcus sp. 263_SSPC]|uniref:hypothetical protein n=1 Tax=Streptococcus sp. 263_SSPC TaxID=1579343 RepID=UPI00065FD1FB|nr:hypothetical protein [Streptococcus sp. 263_SSPC]DAV11060.1 MAG TPA: glycosyltransferase family protein [Caudoviricetes sp.]
MKKSEFKEMINRGTESLSDYEIKEIFHFIGLSGKWTSEQIDDYLAGVRVGMEIEREEYPYCFEEEE